MRVISWNMGLNDPRFNKLGLHDQAWHYLLGLGPDLAFLQETLPPGWVHGDGRFVSGPFNKWGSVIFSPRYPIQPATLPDDSRLRALGTYLAAGAASLPDGTEAFVVSVHARAEPATKRQLGDVDPATITRSSVPRPRVNDLVFFELSRLVGSRFIAAGDWNTGRTQSSATAGTEFFQRAHDHGRFDCVADRSQDEVQTLFRDGSKLIQDDHVFCDPSLGDAVGEDLWAASDAARHLGLSDHAPLIADFNLESIAMTNLRDDAEPNGLVAG